ncbi:MAG: CBS domain-containing protein, partial [Actinomycetota bacterium]
MPATSAKARPVSEIMKSPVVTVSPSDYVATCASMMEKAKVGSVVVVDESKVVGIFTERDLLGLAGHGPG